MQRGDGGSARDDGGTDSEWLKGVIENFSNVPD